MCIRDRFVPPLLGDKMAAFSGPCRFRRLPVPSSWQRIFSLRDVLCPNVFVAACAAAASRVPRAGLLRSDACVSADSDPSTPRATRSKKRARSCQGSQLGLAACGAVLRPATRALLGPAPLPEVSCRVDDGFEAHVSARRVPLSGRLCPREACLLYTSPSPRDRTRSRMPSSA